MEIGFRDGPAIFGHHFAACAASQPCHVIVAYTQKKVAEAPTRHSSRSIQTIACAGAAPSDRSCQCRDCITNANSSPQ